MTSVPSTVGIVASGEDVLNGAVFWVDAGRSSVVSGALSNLGTGGSALNAVFGNSSGVDSFDPALLAKLKPQVGDAASLALTGTDPTWLEVTDAIAAGPRLVKDGAYAVNPGLEGFDPTKEIWRSTRQVGFGVDARGWYTIAMLELGTPEEFAQALVAAGLRDALRFDSGTSAQVALAGGLISGRWGRTVPNALVFVPR